MIYLCKVGIGKIQNTMIDIEYQSKFVKHKSQISILAKSFSNFSNWLDMRNLQEQVLLPKTVLNFHCLNKFL